MDSHFYLRAHLMIALMLGCARISLAATATDTFEVSATVQNGCAFGSQSTGTGVTDMGTLDFGTLASVGSAIDATSSAGAGSIVLTCTPGMTVAIALDYGRNAGSASARHLASGDETLAYQLYKEASHGTVWGTQADGLAMSIANFPASTTTYTVYARLFAVQTLPSAGVYSDVVTITLSY